jgi:hypothetical protein
LQENKSTQKKRYIQQNKHFISQVNSNKEYEVYTLPFVAPRGFTKVQKFQVEAAATCSEIPLSCPYFAGPRRL